MLLMDCEIERTLASTRPVLTYSQQSVEAVFSFWVEVEILVYLS
jgi:hypothetical protein